MVADTAKTTHPGGRVSVEERMERVDASSLGWKARDWMDCVWDVAVPWDDESDAWMYTALN